MEKQQESEEEFRIITPEQFIHARLDGIEKKLEDLIKIAKGC